MNAKAIDVITYSVIRSHRRTADIVIERSGQVVVRAPATVAATELDRVVQARGYHIRKAQAELREMNASRVVREFRSGETFLYLGRAYRLSLVAAQAQPLVLRGGRFYLRRGLTRDHGGAPALAAFRNYYAERGQQRLRDRVDYFAPKVGTTVKRVDVRELGSRWASCTPTGRLAFHWKCVMAPLTIIDYIVVHELCHLLHRNHSEAFWNEVDKILPDARARKEWLRVNGASLAM